MPEDLTKARILIVDDSPECIEELAEVLSCYKRNVATNGEKAIKIASADAPPDLILLDIMMPDLDGFQVLKKLKADEKTKNIPVIFITGKNSVDDETKGLQLGAVDFITKPINPAVVKARVKNHLELKITRECLAVQNKELSEAAKLREDVETITRHDLKIPLVSILGYPYLILKEKNLSDTQKGYLKNIEEEAKRMLSIINLSLDLFKMERKLYVCNPTEFDVFPIFERIKEETELIREEKKVEIEFYIEAKQTDTKDIFIILGERLLCYTMFSNLIKNAIEASPSGKAVIVSMKPLGGSVEVSIINSGVVPFEKRDSFFDKLSTINKKGGTGLGTYSAKLIADTHRGSISMFTSDGKDITTVTVRLPV